MQLKKLSAVLRLYLSYYHKLGMHPGKDLNLLASGSTHPAAYSQVVSLLQKVVLKPGIHAIHRVIVKFLCNPQLLPLIQNNSCYLPVTKNDCKLIEHK